MRKMTVIIASVLLYTALTSFGHEEKQLGPNGGRVVDFSKDGSVHGEVVEKDGQFQIQLLDREMKPLTADQQRLTALVGDRSKPEKLAVEKRDGRFVFPAQKRDDYWMILQYQASAEAKPVTARFHYQSKPCPTCNKPEWLCDCHLKKGAKK